MVHECQLLNEPNGAPKDGISADQQHCMADGDLVDTFAGEANTPDTTACNNSDNLKAATWGKDVKANISDKEGTPPDVPGLPSLTADVVASCTTEKSKQDFKLMHQQRDQLNVHTGVMANMGMDISKTNVRLLPLLDQLILKGPPPGQGTS